MTKTMDVVKTTKSNEGMAQRSNMRSQNVSKRSNLYRDIWNKTAAMPASNIQMINPLSNGNSKSKGFEVAKSTQ